MSSTEQRYGRAKDRQYINWHCKRCETQWNGHEDQDVCACCGYRGEVGDLEPPTCSSCGRAGSRGQQVIEASSKPSSYEAADWVVDGEGVNADYYCITCITGDDPK